MGASTRVPLEEYLARSYEPDCEYVDGQIIERHVGEYFHSLFQSLFIAYLVVRLPQYSYAYRVLTEARMRVRAGSDDTRRYRIPDVMVVPIRDNPTRIILEPPLLVLEILSPDDRLTDVVKKSADYEAFGIPHIWVVDPESKEVWVVRDGAAQEMLNRTASFHAGGNEVTVDFNEIFESPAFA